VFPTQQAAAAAAGQQGKAWQYILLFYNQQGTEDTGYVNDGYLTGLAKQIPSLNYSKWNTDRQSSTLTGQVTTDEQAAAAQGFTATPSITFQGPKGKGQPIISDADYGTLQQHINAVS
jgi:protein-disulfide isomerase